MYKWLVSLIVFGFFVGCSSTVPNKSYSSNSKNKVSKKNHAFLGSGKSYCQSNGGDWRWNGQNNQWECQGFDMSSFYAEQDKYANEKRKKRIKEEKSRVYNEYYSHSKDFCISNKGHWKWNGSKNKWQCLVPKEINLAYIKKHEEFNKKINKKIIGSKNFKNVKFINGVLWEDQAYNRNRDETFNSCQQHCQSLNLLGVNKWQIPTREQYDQIKSKGV